MDTTVKYESSGIKWSAMSCIVFLFFLGGCEDLFEKDISGKTVRLVAPADSIQTIHGEQNFAWEELSGGSAYRLEVARPNFEQPELFLLDTLVTGNTYSFTLKAGTYAWRVRPENSAYKGVYATRTIEVLSLNEK